MNKNASITSNQMRRTAKDSVFCDLFSRREYVLRLYKELHPEDSEALEDDVEIVTLDRVVTDGPYNDLGFVARDKLVILVEAQSTWSFNIATRMLFYLVETYREIALKSDTALYGSKVVPLPAPELCVIYTGSGNVPDEISFRDDVLEGAETSFDFRVQVIKGGDGIIGQYTDFAHRFDDIARRKMPAGKKTVKLLDECIADGILSMYLKEHYWEVNLIMRKVFDQEEEYRRYINALKADLEAEYREKGLAEGREEGRAEGLARSVRALMEKQGMTADEAFELLDIPEQDRAAVADHL